MPICFPSELPQPQTDTLLESGASNRTSALLIPNRHRRKHRKLKRIQEPKLLMEYLPKVKAEQLKHTVRQLMTPGLGILAGIVITKSYHGAVYTTE